MKPRERETSGQHDLFRSRLDQILDMGHAKVVLASLMDWCQRRSKISPPGRSKTSPLNVMRYAVLGGCPGSP